MLPLDLDWADKAAGFFHEDAAEVVWALTEELRVARRAISEAVDSSRLGYPTNALSEALADYKRLFQA